jgi:hypothetical protein
MLHKALLAVVLPMIVAVPTISDHTVIAMQAAAESLPNAAAQAQAGSARRKPYCYGLKCTLSGGLSQPGQSCVPDRRGDYCKNPHGMPPDCYFFKCSQPNGFNAPGQSCVVDPDGSLCRRSPVDPDGTWKIAPPPPSPPPSPSSPSPPPSPPPPPPPSPPLTPPPPQRMTPPPPLHGKSHDSNTNLAR